MKKKLMLILTVAALAATAGCGKNKNENISCKGSYENGYFVAEQPQKLTISWMYGGNAVDPNLPIFQKAKELTNIEFENVLSKNTTDENQAISLMMASGELPDILSLTGRTTMQSYAKDGAIIPITDYVEKFAPNMKKIADEMDKFKMLTTFDDGNMYYAPMVLDGDVSLGWFVRQDWLDKLGLTIPETADEMYTVLKAFKEQDPNGNGIADEVPYFNRNAGTNFDTAITCLYVLWDACDDMILRDDKVVYGPMEEQYKTAVKNVGKWYAEGLIDQEIFTRGSKARDVLLGQNKGGVTYDWIGSTAQYNDTLAESVKGINFVPIAPPGGRTYDSRGDVQGSGWVITSKCKNPELAVKYIDFWYSETGRTLANYGIEGDTYTMENGKAILTDKVLKAEKPALSVLNDYGCQFAMPYHQDFEYEKQWLTPIALKGMEMYRDGGYIKPKMPIINMTLEEQEKISNIRTTVTTYIREMQQQWIMGSQDIDEDYDNFIATLKQMKIAELVDIYQKAYDRNYK